MFITSVQYVQYSLFSYFILIGKSVESIADFSKQPIVTVGESKGKKVVTLDYPEMEEMEFQVDDDKRKQEKRSLKRTAENTSQPHESSIRHKKAKLEGD